MSDPRRTDDLLEAFLDGQVVDAADRAACEQRMAGDAQWQQQAALHRSIHAALARHAAAPPPARIAEIVAQTTQSSQAVGVLRRRWWASPRYAIAASVAAAVLLGSAAYMLLNRGGGTVAPPPTPTLIPLAAAFERIVKAGFEGEVECDHTKQLIFAASIWRRTDQALALPMELPAGMTLLGFTKCSCLSYATLMMMARVDGREVVVFFDRRGNADRAGDPPPVESGLHLHRRDVGAAVLYEISPFESPALLPLFYDPGFSELELSGVGAW